MKTQKKTAFSQPPSATLGQITLRGPTGASPGPHPADT